MVNLSRALVQLQGQMVEQVIVRLAEIVCNSLRNQRLATILECRHSLLKQLSDAKEQGDSYRDGLPKYKVV